MRDDLPPSRHGIDMLLASIPASAVVVSMPSSPASLFWLRDDAILCLFSCLSCLPNGGGGEGAPPPRPPELEPHFTAASFLPVRHGSSLARCRLYYSSRRGAMAGEGEEEEDEVDYVDGVWAVGTPLRVGAMRQ